LYSSPDIFSGIQLKGERDGRGPCHFIGEKRNVSRFLVEKPEGKSLGILGPLWKYNIETVLEGIGWDGLDWVRVAQGRNKLGAVVNKVTNIEIP
jgi:hypothetical protein